MMVRQFQSSLVSALLIVAPVSPTMAAAVSVQPPPAVSVVAAIGGEIVEKVTVSGSLAAREEILVGPLVEGLAVTEILAEEGDTVVQGQVLARLSKETLVTSLAQAAAQVAKAHAAELQARAQIEQAAANTAQTAAALGRSLKLEATGATSRETLDQRQASARVAAAQGDVAQGALALAVADGAVARAQLQDAEIRLSRTEVRAPLGGTVIRRTVRVGGTSSLSAEPMFRLAANGDVELDANVPEAVLGRLAVGQVAVVDVVGNPVGTERLGSVRLVSPEVGAVTRLGKVRVAFTAGDHTAVGGFARARIVTSKATGVLVPLSAVLARAGGSEVQVVHAGVVETRHVHVGLRNDRSAQILDGVGEGEDVVSVSGTFVRSGDLVSPVRAVTQR